MDDHHRPRPQIRAPGALPGLYLGKIMTSSRPREREREREGEREKGGGIAREGAGTGPQPARPGVAFPMPVYPPPQPADS